MKRIPIVLALLVMLPTPAPAQKSTFADALIEFHSALPGTYGDEGARITGGLERLAASLEAWEQSGLAAERELKSRAGTTPADLALLHLEQGRLAAAVEAMTAAVQAEPRRAALRVFLGMMHEAAGRPAEAAAALETAWELDPGDPVRAYLAADRRAGGSQSTIDAPLIAALMEAHARDQKRRAPFLELALIADGTAATPIFAPSEYAEGFALMAAERYRAGLDEFRRVGARDPLVTDPAARHRRAIAGLAALRENRGAEAIAHLEATVAALPASPEAHRMLGIVYRATGRLAESITAFEAAVGLAPRDARARVALGTTLAESGDLAAAERALGEAVRTLPASGDARWALADVYERLGRGLDAIATLEEAASLTVVAGKAALYWRIAELAHRHQEYDRVIAALSRRARLLPNEPAVHRDLGMAYSRAGRNDEALVELLAASILGDEDAEMLAAIGQIHLTAGAFAAAEAVLARAIALDASLPQARYALGQALLRLGRPVEAKTQLDEFQRLRAAALEAQRRGFEIETLIGEADLHVRAGRLEAAIGAYEKAGALGGPAEVYKALAGIFEKLGRAGDRAKALAAYEQRLKEETR